MNDFYSTMISLNGLNTIGAISNFLSKLGQHRAKLFGKKIGKDFSPFKKFHQLKPNIWLLENFNDNGIVYNLEVQFSENGSARIDFWAPKRSVEDNKKLTDTILASIGLIDEFENGGKGGGLLKVFTIKEYRCTGKIDEAVYDLVKQLFDRLR